MSERGAASWSGITREALLERWGVPDLHLFDAVGSTNEVARRLAAGGAAPGTLIVAERQLAGRGRAGRPWDSPPGLGLWMTMIAPPPAGAADAGALPLRIGAAVAIALDGFVEPDRVGIKWPNDLILSGRKMGGILCEGTWTGSVAGPIAVGIGLNLLHREHDFPPEVRGGATSLAMAGARRVSRLDVADAAVPAVLAATTDSHLRGPALGAELELRDILRGSAVRVSEPGTGELLHLGVAMGIARDGGLLIRDSGGVLRTVRSGTVRPAVPAGPPPEPSSRT